MTTRAAFPPPPAKTPVLDRAGGTMGLGWLAWFDLVTRWIQRVRVVSATHDWPSIPANGDAYVQISVPGAAVGDFALASIDPADRDIAVTAQVTAADEVTVWARNLNAGAIDLASGTVRVRVEKAR